MQTLEFGLNEQVSPHFETFMTKSSYGSVRPDNEDFAEQTAQRKEVIGFTGDIVAQRLGMNQKFTDAIKGPESLEQDGPIHRTVEKTDGLILPGANFSKLSLTKEDQIAAKATREQFDAVEIYNADCPVIIISDTKNRINAVLHGGLDCLFSKANEEGQIGESLFVNTVSYLQSEYDIQPDELQVHISGGAEACCFGYNINDKTPAKLKEQVDALEEWGGSSVVQRGGILRGPRKGGDGISVNQILLKQAKDIGVTKVTTNESYCTCCEGRHYEDMEETKSGNAEGDHFSNVYKDGDDKRRNAFTVKLKKSPWEKTKNLGRKVWGLGRRAKEWMFGK